MIDEGDLFERSAAQFDPPADALERFIARRERHERNRRLAAAIVAAVIVGAIAAAAALFLRNPTEIKPAPAPDAFAGMHGWIAVGGTDQITAVDPTGQSPNRVLWPTGGSPLAWSPDGSKLLVLRGSNLVVLSSDGTESIVTDLKGNEIPAGGSFTPDGNAVIYELGWSILQVPIDGGEPTVIAKGDPQNDQGYLFPFFRGGQVSSKGVIAYGPIPPANLRDGQVWLMHLDGSGPQKLISTSAFANTFGDVGLESIDAEAWSPDGSRLAIMAVSNKLPSGSVEAAAFVVNADGTGLRRVTPDGINPWSITFSPDGRSIAGVDNGELVTVGLDGTVHRLGGVGGPQASSDLNSAWNPAPPDA